MLLTRRLPLALTACLLAACSSTPAPAADAAPRDATSRDSSIRDTGAADTGRADTGATADVGAPDAGPEPLLSELEWVRLEGQPTHCIVERAVDPGAVFDVRWLPCPGVEGCEYLDTRTTSLTLRSTQIRGSFHAGQAYFTVLLDRTDGTEDHVLVLIGADSGSMLALRTIKPASRRYACPITTLQADIDSVGIAINNVIDHTGAVYRASFEDLDRDPAMNAMFSAAALRGSIIQTLAVSDTTMAGQLQPGGRVFIVDGARTRIIEPGEGPLRGNPQAIHVSGHEVIWEDWPGVHDTRLVHATIDTGPDVLVAPGPGVDVKSSFLSTSGWLAWMQGSDITPVPGTYRYGQIESWVADTRDMTNFRPHLLTIFDSRPLLPMDGPETYVADAVIGPDGPTELTTTGEDSFLMYDLARRERRLFRYFDPSLHRRDFGIGLLVAESPTELFYTAGMGTQGTYIRLDKSVWLSSPPEALPDVTPPP